MTSDKRLPIFFLAFANDRSEGGAYLRNLPEELRQIRSALESAKQNGLCDYVERANATITDILAVFQKYRNQIAVFHYAGHADGFRLLLESSGLERRIADAGGLAAFLGQQQGLDLVFLNACSTQPQVEALLNANVPVVIATAQAVNDEVAKTFASLFYQSLATGANISTAYKEAEAGLRFGRGDNPRTLYAGPHSQRDRWPWSLYFKDGAESSGQWNLPGAVDNPLFGVAPLPDIPLPEEPFRHLSWFAREHAGIFFGRDHQIRALYDRVTSPHSTPIILLYGQTGAGKSSILAAGVLPRLEANYEIRYVRRDQGLGLLGTLQKAISPDEAVSEQISLAQRWANAESEKPLLIVFDQMEEVFTRPNKQNQSELADIIQALEDTFTARGPQPKGKLILAFRKEWLPEIEEGMKEKRLARSKYFLDRLDRRGIVEAIAGATHSDAARMKYGLRIDPDLPDIIASDLLADQDSPIAPTLQILLTKMWKEAVNRNNSTPVFDSALYYSLKQKGILLGDFLNQQLVELSGKYPEPVSSGLALDILSFHTTDLGTAEERTSERLLLEYAHRQDVLPSLIQSFKDLYLLSDPPQDQNQPKASVSTRLAHDTLAPLVRAMFGRSVLPGQKTRRILENRSRDWLEEEKKKSLDQKQVRLVRKLLSSGHGGTLLNDRDLATVESGLPGMRDLRSEEKRLVQLSGDQRSVRNLRSKLARAASIAALVIIIASAGMAWWLRSKAVDAEKQSLSRQLAAQSQLSASYDPAGALALGIEAAHRSLSEESQVALSGVLEAPLVRSILHHQGPVTAVAFSPDGKTIATASADQTARLWDAQQGTLRATLRGHSSKILTVAFSPDGRRLLTGAEQGIAKVWDVASETTLFTIEAGERSPEVFQASFSPDGVRILIAYLGGNMDLWDAESGAQIHDLPTCDDSFTQGAFSADSGLLVTWGSQCGLAQVWDGHTAKHLGTVGFSDPLDTKGQQGSGGSRSITQVVFSPDSRTVLLVTRQDLNSVWDPRTGRQLKVFGEKLSLKSQLAAFSPDGQYILTANTDHTISLRNASTFSVVESRFGHTDDIFQVAFTSNGRRIVTASKDNSVRIWDARNLDLLATLGGGPASLKTGAFSNDGLRIVTASGDNTAQIWDTEPTHPLATFHPKGSLEAAEFLSDGKRILTCTNGNGCHLWDAETSVLLATSGKVHIGNGLLSPDGQRLVLLETDHTVSIWSPATGQLIATTPKLVCPKGPTFSRDFTRMFCIDTNYKGAAIFDLEHGRELAHITGHAEYIRSAVFSPDGTRIVTATADKTVRVLDAGTGRSLGVLLHDREISEAEFTPDGKDVLTIDSEEVVRRWDIARATVRYTMGHKLSFGLRFSPDGTRALGFMDHSGHAALLFDLNTGQPISSLEVPGYHLTEANFSPDSKRILKSLDRTAYIWNAQTGKLQTALVGHTLGINDAQFSMDGQRVATASLDGTAKLWDAATGHLLSTFKPGGKLNSVAFSSDGKHLLVTGFDEGAYLYPADLSELLRWAELFAPKHYGEDPVPI